MFLHSVCPTTLALLSAVSVLFEQVVMGAVRGAMVLLCLVCVASSIQTGVGWSALRGRDVCLGKMHTYVRAATIASTTTLAVLGLGMVLSVCSKVFIAVAVLIFAALGGLQSLGWVITGIQALKLDNNCQGTLYFVAAVVFVVSHGLCALGTFGLGGDGGSEASV